MLPPVDSGVLVANPKFDALYCDLCTNKLDIDGASRLDAKALKESEDVISRLDAARAAAAKRSLIDGGLYRLAYRGSELPDELREVVATVSALLQGQVASGDRDILDDDLRFFKSNADIVASALSKQWYDELLLLARIANPERPPNTSSLPSRISSLSTVIAGHRNMLARKRLELAQQGTELHAQHRRLLETCIRILEQAIHGSVSRATKAKADYFALVAEGMGKKLGIQHQQMLAQLYSSDMQEALQQRHESLAKEDRSLKRTIMEMEERLELYDQVKGMKAIAQAYREVLNETEKVKAELARLEKS